MPATDPLLRTKEQWDAILDQRDSRRLVRAACIRQSATDVREEVERAAREVDAADAVSLDALCAKYAALRSAAGFLAATLMGFTADDLRKRVNEIHGPSFDAACEALWDVLNDDPTADARVLEGGAA